MYGFIEKDSDLKIEDAVYDEVLNAGLGWMHELKKGQTFRILDIEGNQAVDTTFYDWKIPRITTVRYRQSWHRKIFI
mgnify:CR=1 FL=1